MKKKQEMEIVNLFNKGGRAPPCMSWCKKKATDHLNKQLLAMERKKKEIDIINLYKLALAKKKAIDHINRLPDEILVEIFNGISEAKKLFYLSMVSKRFASLIPYHSPSTITLQLPRRDDSVISRYGFIDSFKHFLKQFHFKHTLHIRLTRKYYNVDILFESMPNNKPPQYLILSTIIPTIIPGMEMYGGDHYCPLLHDIHTTQYFPPLYPGYNACGRWEEPLRRLLFDSKENEPSKNEYEPLKHEYVAMFDLPKSGREVRFALLSVTPAAWGDDGVFFRNNTRGKDAVLLETVREVMNFYT